MLTRLAIPIACALALSGCATEGGFKLPGVYRLDIQQGNVIEQDMIDKLKPGMDKNQVRFILGTPVLVDTFHTNRWEYVYMYSEGGRQREQRRFTVFFKDDKLAHIEGDVVVAERKTEDVLKPKQAPVDVPVTENREGLFSRLFDALPFVGEEEPKPKKAAEDDDKVSGEAADTGAAETQDVPPAEAAPTPEPAEPADASAVLQDTGATDTSPEETEPAGGLEPDDGTSAEPDETTEPEEPAGDENSWPAQIKTAPEDGAPPGWPAEEPTFPEEEEPLPQPDDTGSPP